MKRPISIPVLVLCVVLLAGSPTMARGLAPDGKTYFVYVTGLEEDPYEASADCLEFDATQACPLNGEFCLDWQRTEGGLQTNRAFGISLVAEIDDDGLLITLEAQGRVESRGRKSSLSAVGRASALDVHLNFAISGRHVGKARCLRMVEDFYEEQAAAH